MVDDFLLATSNLKLAKAFRTDMEATFDFKSLGQPAYMIGLHLEHGSNHLSISQTQYIRDMETRFSDSLGPFAPTHTPAPGGLRLVKTGVADAAASEPGDRGLYRSLVGSLMYAVVSRPDIATIVSMCARFMENPTTAHLTAARRVLCYLLTTRDLTLTYTRTASPCLLAYVDASWAADPDTRRSRYGYAVYFGRALVSWRSKLHACVCLSSAEAEYIGATEAVKEVMWMRHLLGELGLDQGTTEIFEDNMAVIKMAKSAIVSARNKHMQLKLHYVRERVEASEVKLTYVSTKMQKADSLTKNLARALFTVMRTYLLCPLTLRPDVGSEGAY